MHPAFYVVLGHAVAAVLCGWLYFRRYQLTRPPIGVLNLKDVAIMLGAIVLVPYLYLALPVWLVTGLLVSAILSVLYFTWEPILRARWAIWLAVLLLVGVDIGAALWSGTTATPFIAVNNLVLTVAIVGITNLWAQSGMKARDAAIMAGALAVYDFLATSQLTLMTDLVNRLLTLPFAPLVAWDIGSDGRGLGLGLGDLLLATVFPLVMRKAFDRPAGLWAMSLGLGAIGTLLALIDLAVVRVALPVMVVLGPLMVLQYVYWVRRHRVERTTWQYLQVEPLPRRGAPAR